MRTHEHSQRCDGGCAVELLLARHSEPAAAAWLDEAALARRGVCVRFCSTGEPLRTAREDWPVPNTGREALCYLRQLRRASTGSACLAPLLGFAQAEPHYYEACKNASRTSDSAGVRSSPYLECLAMQACR